jgi:hypothetical protein
VARMTAGVLTRMGMETPPRGALGGARVFGNTRRCSSMLTLPRQHTAMLEYADAARQLDERLDELRRFVASEPSLSVSPPATTPRGPPRANIGAL